MLMRLRCLGFGGNQQNKETKKINSEENSKREIFLIKSQYFEICCYTSVLFFVEF